MGFIEKFCIDCMKAFYISRALDRYCCLVEGAKDMSLRKYIARETLSIIDEYNKVGL